MVLLIKGSQVLEKGSPKGEGLGKENLGLQLGSCHFQGAGKNEVPERQQQERN